jgi:UDP-glucuronate 4-epimerase
VIHLAARAGVRPSIEQPALYARVNVEGTTVLLEEARKCETCARFVQASSSSVYGNAKKVPFSEDDDVNAPISPYAATKRACELIAGTYHSLYGLPIASLRFFTVYGPRQRPDLAIGKFMRLLRDGQPIPMFGDGSTSRDYTFIEDIVAGVLASYDRIPEHGLRIWNLGGSDPVTLREMIDTIVRVTGIDAKIEQGPTQPGDVERTFADTARSERELGYRVSTTFEDGVRRQWEWLRGG